MSSQLVKLQVKNFRNYQSLALDNKYQLANGVLNEITASQLVTT